MGNAHIEALPLPEGAVVQSSILIVSFFDQDGQMRFGYKTGGESSFAGALGLLELAKFDLMGVAPPSE